MRDLGLLESALARPLNKFAYGETDLAALAAAYAFGIARNHPFVDGNKRAAFGAMIVFLGLERDRSRRATLRTPPRSFSRWRPEKSTRTASRAGCATIGRRHDALSARPFGSLGEDISPHSTPRLRAHQAADDRSRSQPLFRPRRALCAGRRQYGRRGGALCRRALLRARSRPRQERDRACGRARRPQGPDHEGGAAHGHHPGCAAARIRRRARPSCRARRRRWAGPSSSGA